MNCENPFCNDPLRADHVTLVTTGHVRRFCTVECLIDSFYHNLDVLAGYTTRGVRYLRSPWSSHLKREEYVSPKSTKPAGRLCDAEVLCIVLNSGKYPIGRGKQ
jgi:hypothetical protein